jgi:putative transposase
MPPPTAHHLHHEVLRPPVESTQYTSIAMGRTLRDSKIMPSMGSKGDPWDSASAESCISTMKNELVKRRTFQTRDQARLALFRYIESFYNPLRRHSSLAMLSRTEYERRYWEDNAAAAAA